MAGEPSRAPDGARRFIPILEARGLHAANSDNVANSELMRCCGTLGATPLIVISRGRSDRDATKYPPGFVATIEQAWQQMQTELAALSSNSQRIIASNSGHLINWDEPAVIIAGIQRAVSAVRARTES